MSLTLPPALQQLLDKLTGRKVARRPAHLSEQARRPVVKYAKTATDVSNDPTYRSVWNCPASGITYYVKPVSTAVLTKLPKDPPLHRRLIVKGDAQSFVYLGIRDGQIVADPPADDLGALEIRISMGGGMPIRDQRRIA
jgi:hypothetical protein